MVMAFLNLLEKTANEEMKKYRLSMYKKIRSYAADFFIS